MKSYHLIKVHSILNDFLNFIIENYLMKLCQEPISFQMSIRLNQDYIVLDIK